MQGSASQHTWEDIDDKVNESELSAPEEIKPFRADAARGNYLSMERPISTIQRKGDIASHVKTNDEGSAQKS